MCEREKGCRQFYTAHRGTSWAKQAALAAASGNIAHFAREGIILFFLFYYFSSPMSLQGTSDAVCFVHVCAVHCCNRAAVAMPLPPSTLCRPPRRPDRERDPLQFRNDTSHILG